MTQARILIADLPGDVQIAAGGEVKKALNELADSSLASYQVSHTPPCLLSTPISICLCLNLAGPRMIGMENIGMPAEGLRCGILT